MMVLTRLLCLAPLVMLVGMVKRAALLPSVQDHVQLAGMPLRPLLQVPRQMTASHVTQDGTAQSE
eukprot:COSAG02_NODE_50546_length_319_cov_723.245455_1_plen_64_part_01